MNEKLEKFINKDTISESTFFEKWKSAPIIKLETYDEWLEISDLKVLRAIVKRYLLDVMRKIPLWRNEIGKIRFSDRSIDEYITFSADRDKLLAAKQIPEFIQKGLLGEFEKSNKDRRIKRQDTIVGFYPIYFNLQTETKNKKAEILIAKDSKGELFFDLFLDYDREKAQLKKGFKPEPKSGSP